jgi:hypothetical protein
VSSSICSDCGSASAPSGSTPCSRTRRGESDVFGLPRRRAAGGGRRQAAQTRRDGRPHRTLPEREDARRFRFRFQPSIDHRLVRELATGRFIALGENVLIFGPPGVGKTHLAIALGRAAVETGHSVLFTSATALLAALARAETERQLADRLLFYSKPKLLIIDELGYLPFERRSAHLFFQLVARRYERGSLLITTTHDAVGHRPWRRSPRCRDSRSPPVPQSHADDPRRKCSVEAKAQGRPARHTHRAARITEGRSTPRRLALSPRSKPMITRGVNFNGTRGSIPPVA